MPYRIIPAVTGNYYHIYNRGVNKQPIYEDFGDYQRHLEVLLYYQFAGPKPKFSNRNRFKIASNQAEKTVEIVCYCLMPNHFHLLLKQLKDGGIEEFITKVGDSYAKYYNIKHQRTGPLFSSHYKAVQIETDEQLLHLSRYIHLNPFVSKLVNNPEDYPFSSYPEFINLSNRNTVTNEIILNFFKGNDRYKQFVDDHKDFAKDLHQIEHLILEEN